MQAISTRLRTLFVSTFFTCLMFQDAIYLPYMHHIGITTAQISLYVFIKYFLVLAIEVPSGILADRWSRKQVLSLALISMLIGLLIAANAHDFAVFIVSGLFTSGYAAARSGMKEAIVYDALLEMNERSAYETILSRLSLFSSIAAIVSSLLGALLAALFGFRSAFYAGSVTCFIAIVFLQLFKEPQLHRQVTTEKVFKHVAALFRAVGTSSEMKLLVVVGVLAGVEINYMQQLDQLWPIALSLPVALYGPLNAILGSAQSVPALLIKRLIDRPTYVGLVGISLILSAAGLLVRNIVVVAASEFLLLALATTLMVLLSGRIQDQLPSSQRSGVESAVSTLGTLAFIGTVLIFSAITKTHSVFVASWVLVIVAVLAAFGAQAMLSTDRRK
jgi:MFS family permease